MPFAKTYALPRTSGTVSTVGLGDWAASVPVAGGVAGLSAANVKVAAPNSQMTVRASRRGMSAAKRAAMFVPSARLAEKSSPLRRT
jgi:hypothetical protein